MGYVVTGQRQTTVSNGLTYVPAMIISAQSSGGNYFNVTVTADNYHGEYIDKALNAAADQIDGVSGFTSGSPPSPSAFG